VDEVRVSVDQILEHKQILKSTKYQNVIKILQWDKRANKTNILK
jgi:hypothetical protein